MLKQSSSSLSVTLDEGRVLHPLKKNILCVEAKNLTDESESKGIIPTAALFMRGHHSRTLHVTFLVRLLQLVRQKSTPLD